MSKLNFTPGYANNQSLFEAHIDHLVNAFIDWFNLRKLDSTNIQTNSLSSVKLDSALMAAPSELNNTTTFELKDSSIDESRLALKYRGGLVGSLIMYTNTTNTIPRGWMRCIGLVINETNYNAEHGAGAYAADGIASSPLAGKYTPDLVSRSFRGVSNTTDAGGIPINTQGSNVRNFNHHHDWFKRNANTSAQYRLASARFGTEDWVTFQGNIAGSSNAISIGESVAERQYGIRDASSANGSSYTLTTSNSSNLASVDIRPDVIQVCILLKVI